MIFEMWLFMLPVTDQPVFSLEVVDFGMIGVGDFVEDFEHTFWLLDFLDFRVSE